MDNIYVTLLVITPISMFATGFFVARQFRSFENVLFFSMMFVQQRLLFSFVMGFFISLMLMLIVGIVTGFSTNMLIVFFGIFIFTTISFFGGVKFGWGASESSDESIALSTTPIPTDITFPEYILVEDLLDSMKITINTKKRWVFFALEAFQLVFVGLCGLSILSLLAISFFQNYIPKSMHFLLWLVFGSLVFYLLYIKFMEALEFIFDKEVIYINNVSVRVEKFGSKFYSKKEFPAENIKNISVLYSLGGTKTATKQSTFFNSNMPAFFLFHKRGIRRYRTFGRAVDLSNAQRLLEMVYAKFPQYKG